MIISKLLNRETITAYKSDPIEDAASTMRKLHVGAVVVVENTMGKNIPVGMLTDRDIVMATMALGISSIDKIQVQDIMSFDLVTASEDSDIHEVIQMMKQNGVKRIPIVNSQDQLLGIVTANDILKFLAKEVSDLSKLSDTERIRERELRTA